MIATYGFYFARPWWLLASLLAVPAVLMGLRYQVLSARPAAPRPSHSGRL